MGVRLLVGTSVGLFLLDSDGAREEWTLSGPHHKGWKVYSALGRGDQVLVGLTNAFFGAHLERSTDRGANWEAVPVGPAYPQGGERRLKEIWQLAPRPAGGLYAGVAEAGLFESPDEQEWTLNAGLEGHPTRSLWQPGAGGLCLHTILPDPKDPDRLYIAISAVGLFRSDDGGASWVIKNEGVKPADPREDPKYSEVNRCVHKAVQDPTRPERLYQQNHTGVYRTWDAGDHWERIETGLPSWFGFGMLMHPRRPDTLYVVPHESDMSRLFAGGELRVYRSDDAGEHWEPAASGLPRQAYASSLRDAFAIDSADPAGLYLGTTGGELWFSPDEGGSWRRLPGHFPRILTVKVAFA